MPQIYHFISGLPRSGSTLLAAILRQNPRFLAATTSPVGEVHDEVGLDLIAGFHSRRREREPV